MAWIVSSVYGGYNGHLATYHVGMLSAVAVLAASLAVFHAMPRPLATPPDREFLIMIDCNADATNGVATSGA